MPLFRRISKCLSFSINDFTSRCLVLDPVTTDLVNLWHLFFDETSDYGGKSSTIITFNQKPHQDGLKALNMAGDHQEQGKNNQFNDGAFCVQVVPILRSVGWGTLLGCQATRDPLFCSPLIWTWSINQTTLLVPLIRWPHGKSGERRGLCNVKKVRVGAVQQGFIFKAGVTQ